MSKTLRTAALVVGAVALASTGVGAAIGAGLIAESAAVAAAAGSFAAAAGTLSAVASGLSLAAVATAKKPSPSAGGSQTLFKADPLAGIPYAMGRTLVAGNIVYHEAHGKDNQFNSFAVVLSGAGPIESLDSFRVEGAEVSFSAGSALGGYAGWMWQVTQNGHAPAPTALAVPAAVGSAAPGWTATHKLSGMAAALWTLKFDKKQKIYAAGTPQPGWIGHWVRVYDPRLDSTYPGGAGSCRALDEASYVWSENPYLHALTWLLGRWQNGVRLLGVGAPIAMIDVAAFVEGANVAEANGWTLGGVVYSTDGKWNVLKLMLQAGGGEPMRQGARISCLINAPRVSLATITVDDIVGDTAVPACAPRRSRINGIVPVYRSEPHQWEMVPAAPVRVAAYVAEDGEPRTKEIAYPLVQNVDQAAELALYDIVNAREFGPVELPLKPRWLGYRPGDCVTVAAAELGLNGQELLIVNRTLDPDGIVTITARSETAAKHGFALGLTGTPPPTPGVTGDPLNDVPAPAIGAWSVAGSVLAAGGVAVPVLAVTGAADNANAEAILFEYKVDGAGDWIAAGSEPPATVRKDIASVTAGTPYLVAVSYRVRGVVVARRVLGPVVTGAYAGIEGPPGADGLPSYTWVAWAYSADGSSGFTTEAPGDRTHIGIAANQPTPVESTSPTAYSWARIQGPAGIPGVDGTDGINGDDGIFREFVWRRAVSAPATPAGNGIPAGWSDDPPAGSDPLWMSVARQQLDGTLIDGWSVPIRHDGPKGDTGTAGVPGPPGADGQPTWIWIAYANNASGTAGFTTGAADGRSYIGIAPNRSTPVESGDPADYSWAKIEGPAGPTGSTGAVGATGATGPVGATGPAGPAGPMGPAAPAQTIALPAHGSYGPIAVGVPPGGSSYAEVQFNGYLSGAATVGYALDYRINGGGWITYDSFDETGDSGNPTGWGIGATVANPSGSAPALVEWRMTITRTGGASIVSYGGSYLKA